MDRVLLVYPMSRSADTDEHLGLAYIASALRQNGCQVNLFVLKINQGYDELFREIELFKPEMIGFTTFSESLSIIIEICSRIKAEEKSIYTVLGGHAATQEAENLLKNQQSIDFIVKGEGEITISELVNCINNSADLAKVNGIVYRGVGQTINCNQPRKSLENLDLLKFPARDIYIKSTAKPPIVLLSTSRGCLGKCSFCSYSSARNKDTMIWRGRNPENVVDEIEFLAENYQVNTFFVTDVTYEDPGSKGKKRIAAIANEIIKRKLDISYEVHMRAENWDEKDQGLLKLLFESGLESVVVGIESGSARALKVYNKIAIPEDNLRIVKLLATSHIALEYGFIMFQPYTTFQECFENIKFLENAGLGYNIKCILTMLEVYPGVSIEAQLAQDGLLIKDVENSIFNYKFVEARIKILAESLCQLPLMVQLIEDFDLICTRLQIFQARVWRKLYPLGIMTEEIEKFVADFEKLKKELITNNLEFFKKCLELAEINWNYKTFNNLVEKYIKRYLPEKIEKTRKLHYEFLRSLYRKKINIKQYQ